jgi:hypothetical protein
MQKPLFLPRRGAMRIPAASLLPAIVLLVLPILSACDSPGAATPTPVQPDSPPADLSVTYEFGYRPRHDR